MARSKRPENGFTIIEVIITLAIAGLIFMIIFNAIPAVIRNSHNNQRKQEVAYILSSVSRYQLNNSGSFPTDPPPTGVDDYLKFTTLSFYDKADVDLKPQSANVDLIDQTHGDTIDADHVHVYNFALCKSDGTGATGVGAGYRDIVAIYRIETGSGTAIKCQQL